MELVQTILAKAVAYQIYVIFAWLALVTLLLLWTAFRQRRVKKLATYLTANLENLRSKIEESGTQTKQLVIKQTNAIVQVLKEMREQQKTTLSETSAISNRVDKVGVNVRDSIADLQGHLAGLAQSQGGVDPAALREVAVRLEELGDEMAWSHHYYDHLKTLEVAVEKLVGPEKMQQLVAKEKTAPAAPRAKSSCAKAGCSRVPVSSVRPACRPRAAACGGRSRRSTRPPSAHGPPR